MKNLIGIILLIALVFTAYWVYENNGIDLNSSKDEVYKDFSIKDTAEIDEIYMSQPNGKEVLISRRNHDEWMVNGNVKAREGAINLILKTIYDIQIQAPVSKKTFDGVVKRLATSHTKVEIYMEGEEEPKKVWYIGGPTASRMGTYMLLEKDGKKSTKPFITHMIMERGYLGTRFFLDPNLWRERLVMRCNPRNIKTIEVWHQTDTSTGFKLKQMENNSFKIMSHESEEWEIVDAAVAIPYLKRFSKVYYEYLDDKTDELELDSIYNSSFREKILISLQDGEEITLRTYFMPVAKGATLGGEPIDYHPERMYAYSSEMGAASHPVVQNLIFDPLLPDYKSFMSSTIVEK